MEKKQQMDILTNTETEFPIGDSGFYLTTDTIDDYSVTGIKHVAGSLWALRLRGCALTEEDEFASSYKTVQDLIIFDADTQSFDYGYVQIINEELVAIFNTPSIDVGWPAGDTVIVKNIKTKKRVTIEYGAPANDGEISGSDKLFVFTGTLHPSDMRDESDDPAEQCTTPKKWAAFLNKKGKVLFKGWYSDYEYTKRSLIVKSLALLKFSLC